jgi:lysophospholipase L1-like esterase
VRKRGWLVACLVATCSLGTGVGFGAVPTARATALTYVALGDSYTSGEGISPPSSTAPSDCHQSGVDYPHLSATANDWELTDGSCGGATSADMTKAQYSDQPPQFTDLSPSTNVVSVGIGGNDNNLFVRALVDCGISDILDFLNLGAPCKALYRNTFANEVSSDASTIGRVIQGIHAHAPNATILVVGYPDILPQSGNCYPTMPLTTGDTAYLNSLEEALNGVLRSEANANKVTFVDTFNQSIGHDTCKSSSMRWVNPIIVGGGGISVHPNPTGASEMGKALRSSYRLAGVVP